MIIDGNKIANKIKSEIAVAVSLREHRPVLAVVAVGESQVMERFITIKKQFARDANVHIEEHRFDTAIDTDTLLSKIEDLALDDSVQGIIVQLPLPKDVDTDAILAAIPAQKDVDVLSHEANMLFSAGDSIVLPPVVGACKEILDEASIDLEGKNVVVIGTGHLVGAPMATWLETQKAYVTSVDKTQSDLSQVTKTADIIVLGAGSPGILKPEMIQEGVVILDAGTSEAEGKLAGDADESCAEKASIFTPVPGGIGPVTVAILFRNLVRLHE